MGEYTNDNGGVTRFTYEPVTAYGMMLTLVLIGTVFTLWLWSRRNRNNDEPPLASESKILIGHALKFAGDSNQLYNTFKNFSKEALECGGVIKTTIGPRVLYFITVPEDSTTVSNECLQKDAIYDFAKSWIGDGLMTSPHECDEDRDDIKQDLLKLVNLEAVIKESMRFYKPAPVIRRHLDKDVKLSNCTLYKGNFIFLFVCGINRHAMWGPDVEEFRPERWLEPSTLPDNAISLPGFGIERRNCIGRTYSIMSMKVTLAHIYRNYLIHSDHTKLKLKLDVILKPISGHYITIERTK